MPTDTPQDPKDPKRSTKEVSRDLMHLAAAHEANNPQPETDGEPMSDTLESVARRVSVLEARVAPMLSPAELIALVNETLSNHSLLLEAHKLRDDLVAAIGEVRKTAIEFQGVSETTKVRMNDIHTEHGSLSRSIEGLNKNIHLMTSLIESRSSQVDALEHAETEVRRDIVVLRAESDKQQHELQEVKTHQRDWEIRVGDAITPIVGKNPAVPDATRNLTPMIDRIGNLERGFTGLQTVTDNIASTVGVLKAAYDSRVQWINRVIPPSIQDKIFTPAAAQFGILILLLIISRIAGIDLNPAIEKALGGN